MSTNAPVTTKPAVTASSVPSNNTPSKLSQFAVGSIPAFKAPINYAAAASAKAKPVVPISNGKETTPVLPISSTQAKPSTTTAEVTSTPIKSSLPRSNPPNVNSTTPAVGSKINPTSSSLAPSNGTPKISGAVPAHPLVSKPIDIHAFFTGGGSGPVPTPTSSLSAGPTSIDRRPAVNYDAQSRSPSTPSVLSNVGVQHHNTPLSSNSRSFAPSTPSFVPNQSFVSPYQQQHIPSPYQQSQQQPQGSPYLQHAKPTAQNIPNGSNNNPYGGQQSNSSGQRSNSFVGSPIMQHQQQAQRNQQGQQSGTPNRTQFPTSPRLSNSGLPGGQQPQGMMFPGQQQQQQWQPQQQQQQFPPQYPYYAYPPTGYAPGPTGPLTPSGSSTPSSIRTTGPGVPPSPSMSMQPPLSASSAQFAPVSYPISPQQSSAILPQHALQFTPSPRVGGYNTHAIDFKPSVEAQSFVPSPRKSAAIVIRDPKLHPVTPKAPKVVAEVPKIEKKEVVVVEADAEAIAAKKVEDDKLVKKAEDETAAKAAVAAAAIVAEAEDIAKVKAAQAAKDVIATQEKLEKDAATAAIVVPVAVASPLESVVEGVTLPIVLPASLPAKPVNGSTTVEEVSPVVSTGPSPLTTARPIDNLSAIAYPVDIKSPRSDLNVDAEPGKYRYDRDFLMQFMAVCQEKPDQLPNLEAIGMLDAGSDANARPGFAGRRVSSMGPPAVPNRAGAPAAGFGGGRTASMGQFSGGMGNFGGSGSGLSSEDRFKASLAGGSRSSSASGGFSARAGGSMSRTSSQSGTILAGANFVPAGNQAGGSRIRSNRGKPRDNERGGGRDGGGKPGQHTTGQGFEDAAPLEATANRWTPTVVGGAAVGTAADPDSPEMVQRKVKALLNKLTLEKFDSISDQILTWANKSENETDGRILRQVIALIFEKATDEANWSEMYARLCRKLMEMVSVKVTDESVKINDVAVAGGALFRKYLLNRCQEDYESGWKQKEVAAAAAAGKAADDNAKKEANEAAKKEIEEAGTAESAAPKEAELLSDEYYAAQKAKRRGLGLVRFIGELYRLAMLTERIMHECIKKLLANTESPEEEDIESLCRLLTTVGKGLDTAKAKGHLDIYFQRMRMIADNPKIASRIRFMIQDVLELRKGQWRPRHDSAGPKLISEIHSDAQRASEESARRTASSSGKGLPRLQDQLSRPGSRRGQGRDNFGPQQPNADGWSTPAPQRPAKAGDLSSFGKIREQQVISLAGPSGHFAKGAKAKEAARPTTPSNPFALLDTPVSEPSGPQRPKLVMAPRTVPIGTTEGGPEVTVEDAEPTEAEPEVEAEEEEEEEDDDGAIDPNAVSMSRAEGERRAGNSVKEFFSVKSLAEGIASIEALPKEYRGILVTAFVDAAMDLKADQVSLTRQLFAAAAAKDIVSHSVFLTSLTPLIVGIVDLAVDIPSAYTFASLLLAGAALSRDEVVALTLLMESDEEDEETVEAARAKLLASFDKLSE